MVLCLVALPIFAILGLFSLKYRKLTLDALECLFKTVTLRKCKSGLDDRIKSSVTGTILKLSPGIAKLIYKNYKIISWLILILFLWSIYSGGVGLYNYVNYGNCNGPESTGFCMYDPTGANSRISEIDTIAPSDTVLPTLESDDPIIGDSNAILTVIEFGCYACPYTQKAESVVQEVLDYYEGKVNFQFKTFYIPHHNQSFESAIAANCAQEQGKYYAYHTQLFQDQESFSKETYIKIASQLGLELEQFTECLDTVKYKAEVDGDTLMGIHAGVPGTPTFFINDRVIVGPKPFKTFKKIIDKELK